MEKGLLNFVCVFVLLALCTAVLGDSSCLARSGSCKYTSGGCSGGSFVRGLCNGPYNRQCCVPKVLGDSRCLARSGSCKYTSGGCSGGSFVRGLCDGPFNRQCCVPTSRPSGGSCSGVNIVSRASWGARRPRSTTYMATPVSLVFIHHTAGATCSSSSACANVAKQTQNFHMDTRRYSDLGYNFLVGGDGKIYEGRGWNRVGAHTYGFNSRSIAISFMGNFMNSSPTSAALKAAQNLIACGVRQGKIRSSYKLYGHRQAGSTACPGDRLYSIIQRWPRWTSGRA